MGPDNYNEFLGSAHKLLDQIFFFNYEYPEHLMRCVLSIGVVDAPNLILYISLDHRYHRVESKEELS